MKAIIAFSILLSLVSCSKNSETGSGDPDIQAHVSSISKISDKEISNLNELAEKSKNHQISIDEINMLHSEGVITDSEKEELLKLASTK